jgi:hypothetical protein
VGGLPRLAAKALPLFGIVWSALLILGLRETLSALVSGRLTRAMLGRMALWIPLSGLIAAGGTLVLACLGGLALLALVGVRRGLDRWLSHVAPADVHGRYREARFWTALRIVIVAFLAVVVLVVRGR